MKIHPVVFPVSAAIIAVFVALGASMPDWMNTQFSALQRVLVGNFGWLYVTAVACFLIFSIWLLFSRFGSIKLGKDDDQPEFGRISWFAMLFSAGMGIGLVFYSVAEPMMHYLSPPHADPKSQEAARHAMQLTFFHWGLHAWGIFSIMGLSLAYFSFRHDLPLSVRSVIYPLIGNRIYGWPGNVVEILAVFGTLFGLATSLGLGVMQINAGLKYLGLLDVSTMNQVILIACITAAATVSVVTGVSKGIRRLSELNLFAGLFLVLFVFFAGPTVFLLGSLVDSIGYYLQNLIATTFSTGSYWHAGEQQEWMKWQGAWTLFFWGWWISWSPFVGMFIARVSRGRTLREFLGAVLFVPTLLTFVWLAVFGNTAIHMVHFEGVGQLAAQVEKSMPTAIFALLELQPLSMITMTLATLVVATYFVTSSDSASLVIDILTSGGHPEPPTGQRVFWATTEGAVAAVLLVIGGETGLEALQTAMVTTALPFTVVLVLTAYCLVKGLRAERGEVRGRIPEADPTPDEGDEPEGSGLAEPSALQAEGPERQGNAS